MSVNIVSEFQGLVTVIDKIMGHQEMIEKEQIKFYDPLYTLHILCPGEGEENFKRSLGGLINC